ncbi:DMT family transporter [Spirosoma jeollabukense]
MKDKTHNLVFPTFATMNYIYILFAFLVGIAITVQAGVNANLRQAMANPILAAAISFGSGFVVLVLLFLATGGSAPSSDTIKQVAWWKWAGGVMGAIYMITVIVSVPKIGTANLVSLSVAGQLLAAVVLDHYGLLGFSLHPANGWRLLGLVFIMAGVLLVVRN